MADVTLGKPAFKRDGSIAINIADITEQQKRLDALAFVRDDLGFADAEFSRDKTQINISSGDVKKVAELFNDKGLNPFDNEVYADYVATRKKADDVVSAYETVGDDAFKNKKFLERMQQEASVTFSDTGDMIVMQNRNSDVSLENIAKAYEALGINTAASGNVLKVDASSVREAFDLADTRANGFQDFIVNQLDVSSINNTRATKDGSVEFTMKTADLDAATVAKALESFGLTRNGNEVKFSGNLQQLEQLQNLTGNSFDEQFEVATKDAYNAELVSEGGKLRVEVSARRRNVSGNDLEDKTIELTGNRNGTVSSDKAKELIDSDAITLSESLAEQLRKGLEGKISGNNASVLKVSGSDALLKSEEVAQQVFGENFDKMYSNGNIDLKFDDTQDLERFLRENSVSLRQQEIELKNYERGAQQDNFIVALDGNASELSSDTKKSELEERLQFIKDAVSEWNAGRDNEPTISIDTKFNDNGELSVNVRGDVRARDAFETDLRAALEKTPSGVSIDDNLTQVTAGNISERANYVLDEEFVDLAGGMKAIAINSRNGADINELETFLNNNAGLVEYNGSPNWDYQKVAVQSGGANGVENDAILLMANTVEELNSRLEFLRDTGLVDDAAANKLKAAAAKEYSVDIDLQDIVDLAATKTLLKDAEQTAKTNMGSADVTTTNLSIKLNDGVELNELERKAVQERFAELLDINSSRVVVADDSSSITIANVRDSKVQSRVNDIQSELGITNDKVKGRIDLNDNLLITSGENRDVDLYQSKNRDYIEKRSNAQEYLVIKSDDPDTFKARLTDAVKKDPSLGELFRADGTGELQGVKTNSDSVNIEVTKSSAKRLIDALADMDILTNSSTELAGVKRNLSKKDMLPDAKALNMNAMSTTQDTNVITVDIGRNVTMQGLERAQATRRFLTAAADAAGIDGGLSQDQIKISGDGTKVKFELEGLSKDETTQVLSKAQSIQTNVTKSKSYKAGITEREADRSMSQMMNMADGIDAKALDIGVSMPKNIVFGPMQKRVKSFFKSGEDKELYDDKIQAENIKAAYEYYQQNKEQAEELKLSGGKTLLYGAAITAGVVAIAATGGLALGAGLAAAGVSGASAGLFAAVGAGGAAAVSGGSTITAGLAKIGVGSLRSWAAEESMLKEGNKAKGWVEQVESKREQQRTERGNDQDLIDLM